MKKTPHSAPPVRLHSATTRPPLGGNGLDEADELRYVIDSVNDLVHSVDSNGRFAFVNRKWCETLGYTFQEASMLSIFDIVEPAYHDQVKENIKLLFVNGQPFRIEATFRTKMGKIIPVEGFVSLGYKDGKPAGTRSIFRDISERKNAQDAIRLQLLAIQSANEGIAWIDPDGNFLHLNGAHVKLFGYTNEEEMIGKGWERFYAAADVSVFKDLVSARLSQHGRWSGGITAKRRDGSTFPLTVSISNVPSGGFLCICHDRTSEIETERQMIQNLAREKQLNELQAHFVSMASHELRTPLATLSLGVEFLVKYWHKLDEGQINHSLQTVHAGVQQLRGVLDDILVVGRSEEGRLVCKPTPIELVAFCEKLTDEAEGRDLHRHPIQFHCAVEDFEAEIDPQLLRHILFNLLSNACKFSTEKTPVTFELGVRPDLLTFTIADQGIGIPEADQPRLYSLFFRASNAGKVTGSGLGLSVARRCIDAHRGSVVYESVVGRGTRFTVTIPI